MPSDLASAYLRDIVEATRLIQQWVGRAGTVVAATQDDLYRSAIERQLLIISEAAIRLDRIDSELCPRHAPEVNWAGVRGIGNVLRHRYDRLDAQTVADVVSDRLDQLNAACQRLLETD